MFLILKSKKNESRANKKSTLLENDKFVLNDINLCNSARKKNDFYRRFFTVLHYNKLEQLQCQILEFYLCQEVLIKLVYLAFPQFLQNNATSYTKQSLVQY